MGCVMHLVHNERTRLTATWFNGMAVAFIAAGLFAPLAALAYGITEWRIEAGYVLGLIVICMGVGLLLHLVGRLVLGGLRE